MAERELRVEAVGVCATSDGMAAMVMDTNEGPMRVVMPWASWEGVCLMLAVAKAELVGITCTAFHDGSVVAYEAEYATTMRAERRKGQ